MSLISFNESKFSVFVLSFLLELSSLFTSFSLSFKSIIFSSSGIEILDLWEGKLKIKHLGSLSEKNSPYIIAELSANHNGSLERALKSIKAAKEAGANALVSGSTIFRENQGDLKKNIGILRTN